MGKHNLVEYQALRLRDLLEKDGDKIKETKTGIFHLRTEPKSTKDMDKVDMYLKYNLIDQQSMPVEYQQQYLEADFSEVLCNGKDYPAMHNVMSSGAFGYNLLSRVSKDKPFNYNGQIGRSVQFEVKLPVLASTGFTNVTALIPSEESLFFIDTHYAETFKNKEYVISDRFFSREDYYEISKEQFTFFSNYIKDVLGDNCAEKAKRKRKVGHLDQVKLVKHMLGLYNFVKIRDIKEKVYYINVAFELTENNIIEEHDLYRAAQVQARTEAETFKTITEEFFKKQGIDFEYIYINAENFLKYLNDDVVKEYYNNRYRIGR